MERWQHIPVRPSLATTLLSAMMTAVTVTAAAQDGDAKARLAAEIARLESEIVEIRELTDWQHGMLLAAKTDPAAMLRQRRPMARCLSTALAPVCDRLTALFYPDDAVAGTGEGESER